MRPLDSLRFAARAATAYPLRTALMVLAMAIGVASVVVLTALGEGARRYVVGEFGALGANLVIVLPGRSETGGVSPGSFVTATPRDLTLSDAQALARLPQVRRVAPLAVGNSELSVGGRLREVMVLGTGAEYLSLRALTLAEGQFLPMSDLAQGGGEIVIGATLRTELFGNAPALGQRVRVGDRRFRVVGVMAPAGQGLGMNSDELVVMPAATAMAMFNSTSLFRILVELDSRDLVESAKTDMAALLARRHAGEADVTLITQDAVLATFDRILGTLTLAVAGIAAISLAVAGILVMNVMLVAVSQRTAEIGLLKALGASGRAIRRVFLVEAALLSLAGALFGLVAGFGGTALLRVLFPALPASPPDWAVIAGVGTALLTGILFGLLPAARAARLDAVDALARR